MTTAECLHGMPDGTCADCDGSPKSHQRREQLVRDAACVVCGGTQRAGDVAWRIEGAVVCCSCREFDTGRPPAFVRDRQRIIRL